MRIYNFKSLYLQKRSMALHENFTDEGLMHFWCLVKISARAIERFLKYVVWNIVHVQPTKNLTYTVYFLTKFIRAETSKHFQSHETKSKRRVISSVGKNKFLIRSLSAFRAFSAHEKGQSITRPNGPTVSRCTKRRFLRVRILCQEFRHIAHHWKDLGQGSWMVPNLGQETVSEPSYGRSKSAISRFQKVRSDFVFPKFLAKNFYSILFLVFF